MNWNDLRGHADQIEMLRRSIGRGRLAHAYLFAGPAGTGKATFARIFAQCLFCERFPDSALDACGTCAACRQMNAGSHPDFFLIGCPEGRNEIPVAAFIGVDDRRGRDGLIHDLSLRPMSASRRIAILDDANRMNEEGANAMLKTLEEPPPDSLLVLVADNLDAVLPTIRSRCQLVRFAALPAADVADLLLLTGVTENRDEAAAAAAMSEGSVQTATQLLNPELRSLRQKLFGFLSAADLNPLQAAQTMNAGLEELGSETHDQRRNALWLIRFAEEFYRQVVLRLTDSPVASSSPDVDRSVARLAPMGTAGVELAMELFDRCTVAEHHIDGNIQPPRTLEALFDDLARTQRLRQAASRGTR